MRKKQLLIVVIVLICGLLIMPYISNTDFLKGSLIRSQFDRENCIDIGPDKVVQLSSSNINGQRVEYYMDAGGYHCSRDRR